MQTTSQRFKYLAGNSVIPIDWNLRVSFTKQFDDDVNWFTLDQSLLDGIDILTPSDENDIQNWFKYEYKTVKDKVISMEWTREIDFPYSVQSAMADVTLSNTDSYFTPGSGSSIDQYILPKRPILLYAGYQTAEVLGQFVGLTQDMPEVTNTEAKFHSLDFLSELYELPIGQTIAMRDVRTDEVIAELFDQAGLVPSQYQLAMARNVIPFLFFEKGMKMGEALRQLMQAEGGLLWLDEQGIYRFTPRVEVEEAPVLQLTEKNIINANVVAGNQIINHVHIRSELREVQNFQSMVTKESSGDSIDNLWVVPANGTLERFLSLTDPAISAVLPTLGYASNVSWFTAKQSDGIPVTSDITTTGVLLTNSYKIVFTNDNNFPVEIDELDLWGEPALIIDEDGLDYSLQVDASVDKYGLQTLEINNNFVGNADNANSLALMILDSHSEYRGMLEVSIKPVWSLQLGDILDLDYKEFQDTYKIEKITNTLNIRGDVSQILILRRYTIRPWFILSGVEDRSLLDSGDVLTY